jgi:eukaryotic-like serine/threonine-protein kinase
MKAERWAQVDRLLDEAMALPPNERAAFLARASNGDEALRQEVASLLAAHERAGSFLQAPVLEVAAQQLAQGSSLIGATLGPYQILSVLGIGGMGEVYLAQDTRLKRRLALKLLPRQFVEEPIRVERFAREARAVSALNHPNIVTVYDIGEVNGTHFIAMEYVEGQTLRAHCAQHRLSLKETIEIISQIAAALAAAHEAGIVHRDIKPENVMVRRDGYVKVLDFGLVKLTEHPPTGRLTQASAHDDARTNPGTVLGTVRYMSPEQALGEEVDRRSDIFSLGVMFYELLAGSPPFKGPSMAATLDAIVHHQPLPLTQLRPELPAEAEHVINRLLEKDRELRYQTAEDLRAALKRLQRELNSSPEHSINSGSLTNNSIPGRQRWQPRYRWAVGVFFMLLAGTLAGYWWRLKRIPEPLSWSRATATQLTGFTGAELFPAFSPDGKEFVYARRNKDNWDIYQQRLSGTLAQNLTENSPSDDTQPTYSPKGDLIAFRSERQGGGIFIMGASGESPRKLSEIGFYPDWSPDGKEIIFSSMAVDDPFVRGANIKLYAVNIASGQRREIDAGPDAVQPRWSPHGKRIAFWAKGDKAQRDIWTVSPQGGDPVRVTNDPEVDWNPVWSPDGHYLYFISNRKGAPSLWRIPMEEASGLATGLPEPIIGPLAQSWQLNLAGDGKHLIYVEKRLRENIYAATFDPQRLTIVGEARPFLEGTRHSSAPDISPDGQWLTFYSRGETHEDIFVIKTDGTTPSQLTNDSAEDRLPRWTPDGKHLLYYSKASGRFEIWIMNADGSGRRQITYNNGKSLVYPILSPDGRWLSYCIAGGGTFLLDPNKGWQEQTPLALPLIKTGPDKEWFIAWSWSPDSQKLAGWSSSDNGENAYSYIYTLATQTYEKIADIGMRQYWLSDNRHLLSVDKGVIYLLDSQTKSTRKLWEQPQIEARGASISADRRRLFFSVMIDESDIKLLTLE